MTQPPAYHSEVSDLDLTKRLAAGDSDALGVLYDRYGPACYALSRQITADDGFAEAVVQDVFLTLWRNPRLFDPRHGGLSGWLLSATHHSSVELLRREDALRQRRSDTSPEAAMHDLPETERTAIALAYFGGYTQREVAALTGTTLDAVKHRMLAGLRRLQKPSGA